MPNPRQNTDNERLERLALAAVKGITPALAGEIQSRIGSIGEFFRQPAATLQSVLGFSSPIFSEDYRARLLAKAESELHYCDTNNFKISYYGCAGYPTRLTECDDAPLALFSVGKCDLNAPRMVGIVGTRHATAYGCSFVDSFVADLAEAVEGLVIVSGLAYGIDIAAHRAALRQGVPTIAVVAHGLNTVYPAAHRAEAVRMAREGGALLTEYRHDAGIHRGNFLARNRIVAGMTDCLMVAESAAKGGALVTARLASSYNRDVFALPGRTSDLFSQGCNALIATDVARLATCANDVSKAMGWPQKVEAEKQPTLFPTLTADEARIVEWLTAKGEGRINTMSVQLGLPISKLMALMVNLEFNGVVLTFPGGLYRLA